MAPATGGPARGGGNFFQSRAGDQRRADKPKELSVANTLCAIGRCVLEASRPGQAEAFFKRELEIREAKMGLYDMSVAEAVYALGQCGRNAGLPGEAGRFLFASARDRGQNVESSWAVHWRGGPTRLARGFLQAIARYQRGQYGARRLVRRRRVFLDWSVPSRDGSVGRGGDFLKVGAGDQGGGDGARWLVRCRNVALSR